MGLADFLLFLLCVELSEYGILNNFLLTIIFDRRVVIEQLSHNIIQILQIYLPAHHSHQSQVVLNDRCTASLCILFLNMLLDALSNPSIILPFLSILGIPLPIIKHILNRSISQQLQCIHNRLLNIAQHLLCQFKFANRLR